MKFYITGLFKTVQLLAIAAVITASGSVLSAQVTGAAAEEESSVYTAEYIQQQLQTIAQRVLTGQSNVEDSYMLATLASHSSDTHQLNEIIRLGALMDIQAGKFSLARQDLQDLAENSSGEMARFSRELVEILSQCPDGYYTSCKTGETGQLSNHKTLRLAIIERAIALLGEGSELLEDAKILAETDKSLAIELYLEAVEKFLSADTLRGGCARREIIRTATITIKMLKARTERLARNFDADLKKIGKQKLPRSNYTKLLKQMSECLTNVENDLQDIIMLAQCDSESFAVELEWACGDLERIQRMASTINAELGQF